MVALAVVLLILALIFGGVGFAVHALFWIALAALIAAVIVYTANHSARR